MKPTQTGIAAGVLTWLLVFIISAGCLLPVCIIAGTITSTVTADFVAHLLEPYICPEGTTAQVHTYETTTTDEYGDESPSTGYEVRCVDSSGEIIKDLGASYAFIWMGVLAAVILLFILLLATVAGVLVGIRIAKIRKPANQIPPPYTTV